MLVLQEATRNKCVVAVDSHKFTNRLFSSMYVLTCIELGYTLYPMDALKLEI